MRFLLGMALGMLLQVPAPPAGLSGALTDMGVVELVNGAAIVSTAAACTPQVGTRCVVELQNCGVNGQLYGDLFFAGAVNGESFAIVSDAGMGDSSLVCWRIN